MDIAITGSSGLIGTALKKHLAGLGHRPIAVVRRAPAAGADEIQWDAKKSIDSDSLEGIDAVIHLAGAGVGDKRWSDERKAVILNSRVDGTRLLATTLAELKQPPKVLVSGSAVGFYGDAGDTVMTEASPRGSGFLADVVSAWEEAAAPAVQAGIRVPFARTGVVLDPDGGALGKMLPLFKFGLGGRFGSGRQWFPWISKHDELAALTWLLDAEVSGPVNLVAPTPVTNGQFTKALGSALGRPTLFPVPSFGPKLLVGAELAKVLLFDSQRIEPTVLAANGYDFIHTTVDEALADLVGRTREVA